MTKTNLVAEQKTLYLARPLVNKLLAHAQKNPEIEVCGLIGNDGQGEKDYYPVDNVSKNPSYSFMMDAPQQISAMKKMREQEQALFAIVHSHPTSNAVPSALDIEEDSYDDAYYIIVSLNTEGVLEMRAYIKKEDNMREVDLILEDES